MFSWGFPPDPQERQQEISALIASSQGQNQWLTVLSGATAGVSVGEAAKRRNRDVIQDPRFENCGREHDNSRAETK